MQRDVTWRELLSSRQGRDDQDVIHLYRILLEGLDSPVSLGAFLRLKYLGITEVLKMQVRPSDYIDRISYLNDVQAVKFLSKYPFQKIGDPRQAALTTFDECEASCEIENEFWGGYQTKRLSLTPEMSDMAIRVQEIIAEILGDTFPVQEWLDCCRFGPGTFAFSKVPKPSTADKLTNDPTVTVEFLPYARSFLNEFPGWCDTLSYGSNYPIRLRVVPGGKHTTVPKSALTDRNIETQPLLNLFGQLGLGMMIRRRLLAIGIDLDHGQHRNRELARLGSLYGVYATLDLKNASDTIATELVRQLLPERWFHALTLVRTTSVKIQKETRTLQRFSAMGNGFTFELETLIFYAIARACSPKGQVCVFGDDIVLPTGAAGKAARFLPLFGFTVNSKKSFSTGPFRESCGADWFEGIISRPFQLDSGVTDVPSIISLANGLARAACRSNRGYGFDRRYRAAWLFAVRWIPHRVRARLSWGLPQGDEFLFMWRFRGDRFVVTTNQTRRYTSWYAGKAVALYKVYASRIRRDTPYGRKNILGKNSSPTYSFVPGDPFTLFRDWGSIPPFGVDRLVPDIGWV